LKILLSKGRYNALVTLFKLLGDGGDLLESFFNPIFRELLTCNAVDEFTITKADIERVKRNKISSYAHVAALNPSGAGLRFLIENEIEFDVTLEERSTAHFAAVCQTDANLKILVDKEIDLHD